MLKLIIAALPLHHTSEYKCHLDVKWLSISAHRAFFFFTESPSVQGLALQ